MRVFKPSVENYFKTGIIIFCLIILLLFVTTKAIENNPPAKANSFIILFFLFIMILSAHLLWLLNIFRVDTNHLHIYKWPFSIKYSIAWKNIESIIIDKKIIDQHKSLRIIIKTYTNQKKSYRFPVSNEARQRFIELVKTKNIIIKNLS